MKISISIFLTLFTAALFSQNNVKIGYTSAEYIAMMHPDYKVIMKQLEETKGMYGKMLQSKYAEYQAIEEEYVNLSKTGADQLILQDKMNQANNKQREIENFQLEADQALQRKQQELMVPLQNKIQEAIEFVAKEGGYTHIFDGNSMLWMVDAEKSNITDAVLKKLGIPIPSQGGAQAPAGNGQGGATPPPAGKSILEVR
ncbi:OmpH family outer membrane protein [Cyclobacteriaceae bacterium]|nr:OmpH family outer membrane protein [Cyclobacteriaceae bacterium]